MENQSKSGLRELQIAQGLVTLRWVAIPILFCFGIVATRFLGMSFQITPIYFLACILALMNVYFTVHISMLSRQLALRRGFPALKRFILSTLFQYSQNLKANGVTALFGFPKVLVKLSIIFYLTILESLKGLRLNVLSLDYVMHCQVFMDIIALTLFVRFTGSSESPLVILMVIPVIVAGAVMGFYKGGIYALFSSFCYLVVCLLVNLKIITHMKFYGPQYGDLSLSLGWTVSSFIMLAVALLGTAYLSHNLTAIFKERIFFLSQLLDRNRRESFAQSGVADNVDVAWFILDSNGVVLKYKRCHNDLFSSQMEGKNIFDMVPAFRQHGVAYILQSVITSGKAKEIGRITISSAEGVSHSVACRLAPMNDAEMRSLAVLIAEDVTEMIFLKERVNELKEGLEITKTELEKASLDAKEANQHLVKSLKQANDRSSEIGSLMSRLKELDEGKNKSDDQLGEMMNELAVVKASNDTLAAELKYKQMILEEIIELLKNCNQLDQLVSIVERRSKALFKLDNACLHIFRPHQGVNRMNEILDTRKASPRLLDLPRKNPKILDPVLNDGKPVVFMAEVHPDKSAAISVSNGSLRRLVAYIPIRSGNEILGMMMLDRYGSEENPEKFLEMLVYYLGHTGFALKNAISARDWESQRQTLGHTIEILEANIGGLMQLINTSPKKGEQGFDDFLRTLGKLCGVLDALIVRIHSDGTVQQLARLKSTKGLEMSPGEQELFKSLQGNPSAKSSLKDKTDGRLLLGYPLNQGNRLCGVLLVHMPESQNSETGFLDVIARLAAEHMALFTLLEEKELWENFYQENLRA